MVIAHLVEKMSQKQCLLVNILRPRQIVRYFTDIFKSIFLNENAWIPIKISLKFVPRGPIKNILVLVQLMAWRRPGDMPLSWPMMVRLPTHICVTRLSLALALTLYSNHKPQTKIWISLFVKNGWKRENSLLLYICYGLINSSRPSDAYMLY